MNVQQELVQLRAEFAQATGMAMKAIVKIKHAFNNLARSIKRISFIRRSYRNYADESPRGIRYTAYPTGYNKNNPMEGFNKAALSWSFENQQSTRDYYECDDPVYTEWYAARCRRMAENVEREIAMEETLVEAQEVLLIRG